MSEHDNPMVVLRDLRVTFNGQGKTVNAVNGVDLEVKRGEVVALIGESGSGKSVTLRALMRLHSPQRSRIDGTIEIAGRDVLSLDAKALADFMAKDEPRARQIFKEEGWLVE